MQEQIISFECAISAKEKGFNIPTSYHWGMSATCLNRVLIPPDDQLGNGDSARYQDWNSSNLTFSKYSAPSQTILAKWLRDVHNIEVKVWGEYYLTGINWCTQALKYNSNAEKTNYIEEGTFSYGDNAEYETFEDALEKGLIEGLRLVK